MLSADFQLGSIVALVTPMLPDGQIDQDALRGLVDWHVASGTSAIVAMGTTGESAAVSHEEYQQVLAIVVEQSAGRIPVIAGTGAAATQKSVELTRAAADTGVQAGLCVVPYYCKPTQEGIYRHYMAVADASSLPVILYNVPGRTVADLLPATVARLAGHPNITGLKEATGDMDRVKELLDLCGDQISLLSGDDPSALDFVQAGGRGVISVTANVMPESMSQCMGAALAGNWAKARALDEGLRPLHEALFVESNPIPAKWLLAKTGRIGPGIRLPLTPLAAEHTDLVSGAFDLAIRNLQKIN